MEVTYLKCAVDETMPGEPMAIKVINEMNDKLKFFYWKIFFLIQLFEECSEEDFRSINWLTTSKRVDKCINTVTFKFVNNTCPYYLKETFEFGPHCRIDAVNKHEKLKIPFCRTNMRQKAISFVSPSVWNSFP